MRNCASLMRSMHADRGQQKDLCMAAGALSIRSWATLMGKQCYSTAQHALQYTKGSL